MLGSNVDDISNSISFFTFLNLILMRRLMRYITISDLDREILSTEINDSVKRGWPIVSVNN